MKANSTLATFFSPTQNKSFHLGCDAVMGLFTVLLRTDESVVVGLYLPLLKAFWSPLRQNGLGSSLLFTVKVQSQRFC